MFIGSLDTMDESCVDYPERIRTALEYLKNHDFTQLPDGRYAIEGDISVANLQRYTTRPVADCKPETHEKYIDIQFMVEGEEYIGWCPFSPDLKIAEAYDAARDVAFYEDLVPDSNIVLSPGSFAVLYPEDVHRPQGAVDDIPAPVTKVVVKIAVDSL